MCFGTDAVLFLFSAADFFGYYLILYHRFMKKYSTCGFFFINFCVASCDVCVGGIIVHANGKTNQTVLYLNHNSQKNLGMRHFFIDKCP